MQGIFDAMAKGLAPVPGSRKARNSLIHVDDLVQAGMQCLAREEADGQVYELHDGHTRGYDWDDLALLASDVYQRKVRAVEIPRWLLDTIAHVNLTLARLTRRAPMLTPAKLRELRHANWVADNRAIATATGWQPKIELEQGLQALVLSLIHI